MKREKAKKSIFNCELAIETDIRSWTQSDVLEYLKMEAYAHIQLQL